MFDLDTLDNYYLAIILKVREVAMYYKSNDRETITILVDALKLNANIELAYYRLANGYMLVSELSKFHIEHIKPFEYVLNLDVSKIAKHKKRLTLSQYLKLFNIISAKKTPVGLKLNPDIVNFEGNLADFGSLPEIIKKYGVK